MRPSDLLTYVVTPTLHAQGLYSLAAAQLVTATAVHESQSGHYLKQVNGPALGIFQVEPATHRDLFENFLRYQPTHRRNLLRLAAISREDEFHAPLDALATLLELQLITNLAYAAAVCRLCYYRKAEPLPPANDPIAQARYWKAHYNTPAGRGTVEQFVRHYPAELLTGAGQ